uniref:Non-specific serine/threonine protein kinase n=1 Tax=Macrostomum lignano TaxID=282301 RepID=A0A1I8JN92_9PLAT
VNPSRLPVVVGGLLDVDCLRRRDQAAHPWSESVVRGQFSTDELVAEVEKRNRLKLLLPWLENRAALCTRALRSRPRTMPWPKIYIDANNNPERFLRENRLLRFPGDRQTSSGVCNENSLFKSEARYLVKRKDETLWAQVLQEDNPYRRQLIDQGGADRPVGDQRPRGDFRRRQILHGADLPNELIELLEKIVLDNTVFSDHRNLQNLLILTAIKADTTRSWSTSPSWREFRRSRDCSDCHQQPAVRVERRSPTPLFKKFSVNESAIKLSADLSAHRKTSAILIAPLRICREVQRAGSVVPSCAAPQLEEGFVKEAIDSFIKANDPSCYRGCCSPSLATRGIGGFGEISCLLMARRKKPRSHSLRPSAGVRLRQDGRLADMAGVHQLANHAKIAEVADRCFDQEMYEAAKILYSNVKLGEFQNAVESARKANSTKTWKEELINFYQTRGLFNELISLFDGPGWGSTAPHGTVHGAGHSATASTAQPSSRSTWSCSGPASIFQGAASAAEQATCGAELVFLYDKYEEFDNAILTMMKHPTEAWREGKVAMVKPYLKAGAARTTTSTSTKALNSLYIEEEDYQSLRASIEAFNNFDNIGLAQKCEKHELLEFRRVAALLYKGNNRFSQSIELCKRDRLYKDAMQFAGESRDSELAAALLQWFLDEKLTECFSALLRPAQTGQVMELAWRYNLMDYTMPYMVQVMAEYQARLERLEQAEAVRAESDEKANSDGNPFSRATPPPPASAGPFYGAGSGLPPQGHHF